MKTYHEEKTKAAFIRPLFSILGWNFEDIDNVAPEEQASNGRVDYAFKLNNVSQFYLEAKALNKDINDPEYVKQVIDYAYYKGVTWAVLTNFSELRIINAQEKKNFIDLKYDQYLIDFDDLWLLSKESFVDGLLIQKAAIKYGALAPPPPIEELLYRDLKTWRETLSTQIHAYNKNLSLYQMDEVIQKIFNRLIFIRICEDRNIEDKRILENVRQWQQSSQKGELIERVKSIFKQYRGWYDSELFEKHLVDTDKVFVEGPAIEQVLVGMVKYPFDLIDADVLGAVYEQYLSHVAVENKEVLGHQLKLEIADDTIYKVIDKQKYRKSRGIYYTPKYVTNYIVQETVGRFIKENSHEKPNEVFNIKILDMACGSGSFLIKAFDMLLDYYAEQKNKPVYLLEQHERLPILLRNIFGVDLDSQAVEISRLNLLIRSLSKREMLQPLAGNIEQGNSLITGSDEELEEYFGDKFAAKLPFKWEAKFSDIMNKGGFDIIIGNPPYVSVSNLDPQDRNYFMACYETASKRFDIYVGFIEKGLDLLKNGGRLGFIIPYPFLSQDYAEKLRIHILNTCIIESIVDFSDMKVFADALVRNVIIVLKKEPDADVREKNKVQILMPDLSSSSIQNFNTVVTVPQIAFSKMPQTMFRIIDPSISAVQIS